jgi:polysaccharide biosynthesis protein PslL
LISSLQAALGIYITLAIAVLLQRYTLLQKVLSYCGASTLFILLFHGFIQNRLFEALSKLSGHSYLNAALSAIFAIIGSMLLWELTKKYKGLSSLLLSQRR